MNQQHAPSRASNNSSGCHVVLGSGVLVVAAILTFPLLVIALLELDTNPLSACMTSLVFLVVPVSAIWLLVYWLRISSARVRLIGEDLAVESQEQDEAYRAQQYYTVYMAHMSALQGLLNLTRSEFELAIGALFEFWGYTDIQHTDDGSDLAADIICRNAAGQVTVVQCQQHSPDKLLGTPEVEKFVGMIVGYQHAQHGMLVTTSGYTEPALDLGHKHDIRMIDGSELVASMQEFRAALEE